MDVIKLRKTEKEKLLGVLAEKQKELVDKRLTFSLGKEKNTEIFRLLRKDIAQIKTVLKEKEVLSEREGS